MWSNTSLVPTRWPPGRRPATTNALERLDALRALDPQSRAALRMVASARMDLRVLPKAVAGRLMAEVAI